MFDFECFKNEGYEPYVVVKKDDSLHILSSSLVYIPSPIPTFDEQYVDYGMNKLIWIFRLRMQNYSFKVLLHSFCVHVPHPTYAFIKGLKCRTTLSGDMTSKRNQGKLTEMDLYMKEFLKESRKQGFELKTMLPLCKDVQSSALWSKLVDD